MQYMIQNRVTHTEVIGYQTPYIDVSEAPLLTINVIIYSISGTGPSVSATLQTSDDLETWLTVGSSVSRGTAGSSLGSIDAKTDAFGRYARIQISLAGTAPTATFSVALNTFPSS